MVRQKWGSLKCCYILIKKNCSTYMKSCLLIHVVHSYLNLAMNHFLVLAKNTSVPAVAPISTGGCGGSYQYTYYTHTSWHSVCQHAQAMQRACIWRGPANCPFSLPTVFNWSFSLWMNVSMLAEKHFCKAPKQFTNIYREREI